MLDLNAVKDAIKLAERFPASASSPLAHYAGKLIEEVERLKGAIIKHRQTVDADFPEAADSELWRHVHE